MTKTTAGAASAAGSTQSEAAPGLCRLRVAAVLRQARQEQGMIRQQAAQALSWSLQKLTRIETGATRLTVTGLAALLGLYHVTDPAQASSLTEMTRTARQPPWHARRRRVVTPDLACYLDALLARQDLLSSPHCPDICYVLDEAVLRRCIGGPGVMAAQLDRLHNMAAHPRVSEHVLPFTAGACPPAATLTVTDLTGDHDSAAFSDAADGSIACSRDPRQVGRYRDHLIRLLRASNQPLAAASGSGRGVAAGQQR